MTDQLDIYVRPDGSMQVWLNGQPSTARDIELRQDREDYAIGNHHGALRTFSTGSTTEVSLTLTNPQITYIKEELPEHAHDEEDHDPDSRARCDRCALDRGRPRA